MSQEDIKKLKEENQRLQAEKDAAEKAKNELKNENEKLLKESAKVDLKSIQAELNELKQSQAKALEIAEKLEIEKAKVAEEKASLEEENQKLREGMDAGRFIPKSIEGTFTAVWKDPAGKEVKKKMKFKDGHVAIRVPGGARVSTIGFMQLANKGECQEQYLQESPELANWNQEQAQAYLTKLTQMGYGYLVPA